MIDILDILLLRPPFTLEGADITVMSLPSFPGGADQIPSAVSDVYLLSSLVAASTFASGASATVSGSLLLNTVPDAPEANVGVSSVMSVRTLGSLASGTQESAAPPTPVVTTFSLSSVPSSEESKAAVSVPSSGQIIHSFGNECVEQAFGGSRVRFLVRALPMFQAGVSYTPGMQAGLSEVGT